MKSDSSQQFITIAGMPGSGKSTAAKAVAARLGFKHFSSGDLFRRIAKEKGIDVLEANLSAEDEDDIPEIDRLVDGKLQSIGKTESNIVIDSRMAWHWMPFSLKVFLDIDLNTAAERILSKLSLSRLEAEHIPENPRMYAAVLKNRLDSEVRRYKKVYGVSPYDMGNYDLIINTADHNEEKVVKLILDRYRSRRQS